jgi:YD repeat-containing protein
VLSRSVFDRANRLIATTADNGAISIAAYDGADRQIMTIDALGNITQNNFDANGNRPLPPVR